MIVTLTAHPSLDRTISLASPLHPGDVQRAASAREDAAGKGVNVARVLRASGAEATAVLPLAAADPYRALLDPQLPTRLVPIVGHARANLTITDPDGTTTKINLPGARIDEAERDALVDAVVRSAVGARWVALCGSLPPGAPDGFYATIIAALRADGVGVPRIAVDASGAALAAVLRTDATAPDLIKPNEDELVEAIVSLEATGEAEADELGRRLAAEIAADPIDAAARLASRLVPERSRAALVTLGGSGAVLVTADGAWHVAAPDGVRVRSTVGAGDSALAGYLLADIAGSGPRERLRAAVRYGSATAALPGTQLAIPTDLPIGELVIRALG